MRVLATRATTQATPETRAATELGDAARVKLAVTITAFGRRSAGHRGGEARWFDRPLTTIVAPASIGDVTRLAARVAAYLIAGALTLATATLVALVLFYRLSFH